MTQCLKKVWLKDEMESKKHTGAERYREHDAPDPGTKRRGTEFNKDGRRVQHRAETSGKKEKPKR